MRRTVIAVALLALTALLASACSADFGASSSTTTIASDAGSTTTTPTLAHTTTTAASTSTVPFSCSAPPGNTNGTLSSGGLERKYLLEVPAGLTAPAPLVLNLHGYNSNATAQAAYSQFPRKGSARGVIVVTPEGQGGTHQHWNFLPAPVNEADDYAFLGSLLDTLEATGCVDVDREYAAGISNGSAMSAFLACRFNDRLAAVGLVAATVQPSTCAPGQTMPVIAFAGTADPVVPYEGGKVSSGGFGNGIQVKPAESSIAGWATQNGCAGSPDATAAAADVTELDFPACPAGLSVRLYRVEGGGHTWPGAVFDVTRLGATTHSIDATELMLDFFAAHPRSGR